LVSDREPECSKDLIAAGGVAAPPAADTGSRHGPHASLVASATAF